MAYCVHCAVILADQAKRCPLCGRPAHEGLPPASSVPGESLPADSQTDEASPLDNTLTHEERRHIAVELISVALGIVLGVTILADLFTRHGLTWSRYSSVGLVALWFFTAMPLILHRHPWILFAILSPLLIALIFLVDAFDGRITWFLGYGLPIGLLFEICVTGAGTLVAVLRRRGLNVIGIILSFVSLFCVGLEGIINFQIKHTLSVRWSVIVAFALVPVAALLFYIHYRIMHRASLRKLFRL